MANVLTGNPYVCDSTGALTTREVRLNCIVWVGTQATDRDIANLDDLQITDTAGNIIIEKRAVSTTDCLILPFPSPIECQGLSIGAIDGGIAYIFWE